jgi:hypothetical protein
MTASVLSVKQRELHQKNIVYMKHYWKCEYKKNGKYSGHYGILSQEGNDFDRVKLLHRSFNTYWSNDAYIKEVDAYGWLYNNTIMETAIEMI